GRRARGLQGAEAVDRAGDRSEAGCPASPRAVRFDGRRVTAAGELRAEISAIQAGPLQVKGGARLTPRDADVAAERAQHEHRAGVAEGTADRTRRGGAAPVAFAAPAAAGDWKVGLDGAAEAVGLHV